MVIITKEILEEKIKTMPELCKKLDENKIPISRVVKTVVKYFGYYDSVVDNLICSCDRTIFYILNDFDILKTDNDVYNLKEMYHIKSPLKGYRHRIVCYWYYNYDKILEDQEQPEENIYDEIYSEELWAKIK
ncbi:MAG: hypothetical protein J7K26_01265 [Candidatus Aenigmarchaeota archaeon]|nr:hypothetical protein [Candidatus Aenigmarchaeota archaeon]